MSVALAVIIGVGIGYLAFKTECKTPPPIESITTEICVEYRDTCLILFPEVINPKPPRTLNRTRKNYKEPVTEFTHQVFPEITFQVDLEAEQIENSKTWSDWWEKTPSEDPAVVVNQPINEYDLKSENDFGVIYSKIKTEGVLISWLPSFQLKEPLPDRINIAPAPVIIKQPEKVNRLQLNAGLQVVGNNLETVIGAGFSRNKFGVNYNYLPESKGHQLTAGYDVNF